MDDTDSDPDYVPGSGDELDMADDESKCISYFDFCFFFTLTCAQR